MKALVGAFNQEKALVGAFSVIVKPVVEPMDHFTALLLLAKVAICMKRGVLANIAILCPSPFSRIDSPSSRSEALRVRAWQRMRALLADSWLFLRPARAPPHYHATVADRQTAVAFLQQKNYIG